MFLSNLFIHKLQKKIQNFVVLLCQLFMVFNLTFGLFTVPVQAQSGNGVIGFSDCNFGTAEEIRSRNDPSAGNEMLRKCLQQILTFVFVLGIFLIGMRIAVEAFKSLNPTIQGNSIDNSVKLGKDVIIGLILIGAPSLFLGLFNEAALQLPSLFDLSKFAAAEKTPATTGPSGTGGTGGGTGSGTGGTTGGVGTNTGTGGNGTNTTGGNTTNNNTNTGTNTGTNTNNLSDGSTATAEDIKRVEDLVKNDPMISLNKKDKMILDEIIKRDKYWVSEAFGYMNKEEVEKAIADYNSGTNPQNQAKNAEIIKALLRNCLTNPNGNDITSCNLIKSVENLGNILLDYPNGVNLKLATTYNLTNSPVKPVVSSSGAVYTFLLENPTAAITLTMSCNPAESANNSLLVTTGKVSSTTNLNPNGCISVIQTNKIKIYDVKITI